MKTLQDQISDFQFQECSNFIERIKESRHQVVLKRQLSKFDHLWQKYRRVRSQEHAEDGCPNARLGNQRERERTTEVLQDPVLSTGRTSSQDLETSNPTKSSTSTSTEQISKDYTRRWVRNLLSTPLTEAQFSLLGHGPNFTIAPRHPPWGIHNCN